MSHVVQLKAVCQLIRGKYSLMVNDVSASRSSASVTCIILPIAFSAVPYVSEAERFVILSRVLSSSSGAPLAICVCRFLIDCIGTLCISCRPSGVGEESLPCRS